MDSNKFKESLIEYLKEFRHEFDPEDVRLEKRFKEQLQRESDKDFIEHIQHILGDIGNKRILEIGSGSGWRSVALALAGAEVYGIEPVSAGVRTSFFRSEQYPELKNKITFQSGIAENIPYPEVFFDFVISFQVIERVQSVEKSLKEMHRVLKREGIVYIETGNSLWPREEHYRIFWVPHTPKWLGKIYARLRGRDPVHLNHVHFIYKRRILKQMKKAGFSVVCDKYENYVSSKFQNPSNIKNRYLRGFLFFANKAGLNNIIVLIAAKIGFYPGLWLFGKK